MTSWCSVRRRHDIMVLSNVHRDITPRLGPKSLEVNCLQEAVLVYQDNARGTDLLLLAY
jgi:hypothetical protein